jgi:hypothetical protein
MVLNILYLEWAINWFILCLLVIRVSIHLHQYRSFESAKLYGFLAPLKWYSSLSLSQLCIVCLIIGDTACFDEKYVIFLLAFFRFDKVINTCHFTIGLCRVRWSKRGTRSHLLDIKDDIFLSLFVKRTRHSKQLGQNFYTKSYCSNIWICRMIYLCRLCQVGKWVLWLCVGARFLHVD